MWVRDWISAKIWGETTTDEKKQDVIAEAVDTPEEAAARMQRMHQILAGTTVVADATLVELDRQEEKIEQIEGGMDHLEHSQKRAQKSIHQLQYGVVERAKDPQFQPKPVAGNKRRDNKEATPVPPAANAPAVTIDHQSVGLADSEQGLAGLSDQLTQLKLQATLMGGSINRTHKQLQQLKPRVEAATEKNKSMTKTLQGMSKK